MSRLLLTEPVQVASPKVESVTMSRSYSSNFAQSLFTGYPNQTPVIKISAQERIAPLPPPPELSAQLQFALFTLAARPPTSSQLAKLILDELRKSTVLAGAAEYSELMRLGYAQRERGTSFHEITPNGRFLSDRLAKIAARQLGIHHFRVWSDQKYNHITCVTCAKSHHYPAALHHVQRLNGEWMARHLNESGQPKAPISAGAMPFEGMSITDIPLKTG